MPPHIYSILVVLCVSVLLSYFEFGFKIGFCDNAYKCCDINVLDKLYHFVKIF